MTSTPPGQSSSDQADGVRFYDRDTGQVQREIVYAESGVRWCYQTRLGRTISHLLLARRLPSRIYGWYQDSRLSRRKIAHFVNVLGIDMEECARPLEDFDSFNDFFTRQLKPAARPIDPDSATLLSPADGRVWAVQQIDRRTVVPIKGRTFEIDDLLGRPELAERFVGGAAICVRLCPADYHRFHFPDAGTPQAAWKVGGALHSVNPYALASGRRIFDRNQREVTLFDSENFGQIALIDVGAMFVGRIVQTFQPGQPAARGSEKGYFTFGASTTVMLLEPGRVLLDQDLLQQTRSGIETRLKMGTRIGRRAT